MQIMDIDLAGNTHPESWQELTVDVTSPNKTNIYPCAIMNYDTIKCPVLKQHHQKKTL